MINNLGKFIRKIRGDLSLREFSEKIGISHTHLDTIEKGIDFRTGKRVSITLDTFGRLALALNTSIIELLQLAAEDGLIPKKALDIKPNTAPTQNLQIETYEKELIKKYRALDKRGKQIVETLLEREYEFIAPKIEDAAM